MAGKEGSIKDADLRCCTWTWGAFVYINGMKKIWQIERTAAETMKTLYCSTTANTAGSGGRRDLRACARDMHFSMLAKKPSCETTHRSLRVKDYSATLQHFHLITADGSAQEWSRCWKRVRECEVGDIFRQQAQQQVVPHILKPTDCSNWKFTVYSKEVLLKNLHWNTQDLCLQLTSSRPYSKCGSLRNARQQQVADLGSFDHFSVHVDGVHGEF